MNPIPSLENVAQPIKKTVLVFAGLDSSGGAGLQADIEAIGAVGAHPLPIATALTVQDNDRVIEVNPVNVRLWWQQADVLIKKIPIHAVKIGAIGNRANAEALNLLIMSLRSMYPGLPVVLDTILGSGQGDPLTEGSPEHVLEPLIPLATLVTPNLPESARLSPGAETVEAQAKNLLSRGSEHVLVKGGHASDKNQVVNSWYRDDKVTSWAFSRIEATFHGSGCTLASLCAGLLAQGKPMEEALDLAQQMSQKMLAASYAIASGQRIPERHFRLKDLSVETGDDSILH